MSSRFQGRDFQTLRQEMIDFVKERAPETWDSNNVSDPMIRFIETVAMLGDHLHYYIDAMRRESDLATASLASSVYSYALREGYILLLPRSTHFRINLYSEGNNVITGVSLKKFSEFTLQNTSDKYYVLTPLESTDIYSQYPYQDESTGEIISEESPEIELVAGELKEVRFSFADIDYYSRIELPESRIDAEMCELIATSGMDTKEIIRVEDVISDIAQANVFSLTPSFVNGIERLYIEFPYNYRNLFPSNTSFTFRYITIRQESKPSGYFNSQEFDGLIGITRTFGGYRVWENPESIKQNYKHYVRDFTSLVTKADYKSFVNYQIQSRNQVFDISDKYSGLFKEIPVRTMYILSDLQYNEREALRKEILKRSSRSDNIFMIPYGKKLYRVLIIVEADLMGESEDNIRASIANALDGFYNDITEVRDPIESVIYHKIHECNPAIARAWVILISEYDVEIYNTDVIPLGETFTNFPTADLVNNPDEEEREQLLNNNAILKYFYNLLPDRDDYDPVNNPTNTVQKTTEYLDRYSELQPPKERVIYRNLLVQDIEALAHYKGNINEIIPSYKYEYPETLPYTNVNDDLSIVDESSSAYYDSPSIDTMSVEDPEYEKTHFILPSLFNTIVWVYST